MRYRLGDHELDTVARTLHRDGRLIELGGRAFDLLTVLLERRHRVVTAAELFALVWPGVAVQPNNLQVQVWTLRRVLGTHAIQTVARRGYRYIGPVEPIPVGATGEDARLAEPSRPPRATSLDALTRAVDPTASVTTWVCAERVGRERLVRIIARRLAVEPVMCWRLDVLALRSAGLPTPERLVRLCGRRGYLMLTEAHRGGREVRDLVMHLRHHCPELSVLACAQTPLGWTGEQVVDVPEGLLMAFTSDRHAAGRAALRQHTLRWEARGQAHA